MSKVLKNPGTAKPTNLDFTEWPALGEFFMNGGVPGVEYLYLCFEEIPKAQREGWENVVGMPAFRVNGIDLTAMAKGEPIVGVPAGSSVCDLSVSNLASERCKLSVKLVRDDTPAAAAQKLNEAIAAARKPKPEATVATK